MVEGTEIQRHAIVDAVSTDVGIVAAGLDGELALVLGDDLDGLGDIEG